MKITLENYIKNPSGGRAHVAQQNEIAKAQYQDKFDKMMLRVAGHISYVLYKTRNGKRYVLYIRIPSETDKGLYYDVVLDFYTDDDVAVRTTNLKDYYVRFFANDPNFMFTYANVFYKDNLLVNELKTKFKPIVYKQKPGVTNPNKIVGYVKSIYFAYLFYKSRGLDNKIMWQDALPFRPTELSKLVMSGEQKLIQAQKIKQMNRNAKYDNVYLANNDFDNPKVLEQKAKMQAANVKAVKKVPKTRVYKKDARNAHYVKKILPHY